MGARNRKEMADLVSTELAQLDKLSRDLESYWQTKTAESSSIRDWRLRYRTWLRHTESAVGKVKSEDDWISAERARRDFNARMRNSFRKLDGEIRESSDLEARMIAYDPSYADDIKRAKEVYDSELTKAEDTYWDDFLAHRVKVKKRAVELGHDINSLAGVRVVGVNIGEELEDSTLEVKTLDRGISTYALTLRQRYAGYDTYSELESPICTPEHIQAARAFMRRNELWAEEAAEAEIGEGVKDFIRLTFAPLKKDLEDYDPDIRYRPRLAIIQAHKAPTQGPDTHLLDELQQYATGPYDAARGHLDDINALVARVGYGCPPIEVPAAGAQESARTAVLEDIKEVKGTMDAFGFQDHGGKRTTLIEPLRESLDRLLGVSSKRTQKRHIELYRAYASALEVWIKTAWTQFGGTPKGAKEAKYKRMASGK